MANLCVCARGDILAHEKRVPNSIGEICVDIDKTINLNGMIVPIVEQYFEVFSI